MAVLDNGVVVIERTFDAPVERVWEAWTKPEQISKWWGPKQFTSPASDNKIDFRVGGKYLFCMQTPDGVKLFSGGTYTEIVPNQRISYNDSFMDKDGNVVPAGTYGLTGDWPAELRVSIDFEDLDGKTKLTIRHQGAPTSGDDAANMQQGWNETLDKLAESLKA